MTPQELMEGNKAIALFDGLIPAINGVPDYDRHWELLMPVVEEIEALEVDSAPLPPSATPVPKRIYWFSIQQSNVVVGKDFSIESIFEIYDYKKKGITKIQAVWQAVVQFIQWYNTTPSPSKL